MYNLFKVTSEETPGQLIHEIGNGQRNSSTLKAYPDRVLPENANFDNLLIEHNFQDTGPHSMVLSAGCHNPATTMVQSPALEYRQFGPRNTAGDDILSDADSRIRVRVIATDEEQAIAEAIHAMAAAPIEHPLHDQETGGSHGT